MARRTRRRWLTPKSDSLESFLAFAIRLLLVVALMTTTIYLAVTGRLIATTATALLTASAGLLPRWFEP